MKKLLYLFFLLILNFTLKAQYPLIQNLASDSTLVRIGTNYNGAIKGGLVNITLADTATANTRRIKSYPGAMIFTTSDGLAWIRNNTATGWILLGGGTSPSGTFWKVGGNMFPVTAPTRDIGTDATYGGAVGLMTNGVVRAIIPNAGFTLSNDTTSNKIFTWNPSTKDWGYANWNNGGGGGATPTWQQVLTSGSILTGNNTITGGGFNLRFGAANIQLDSTVIIGVPDETPITGAVVGINSNPNRASYLKFRDINSDVTRFNFEYSGNISTASGTIYDASNHALQASNGYFVTRIITPLLSNTQGANDLLQLAPGTSDGRVGIGVNTGADNLTDKLQLKGGFYADFTGKRYVVIGLGNTGSPDSVMVKVSGSDEVKWAAVSAVSGGGGGSAGRLFKNLQTNTTSTGNVGSGEDNLMSYTTPADTLNTNGDYIEFEMSFTFAANGNNKQVKVKYGATTIYDSGTQPQNNGTLNIKGTIVRTGAATQLITFSINNDASLYTIRSGKTTAAETLSSTVILKATGEATADNDIVQDLLIVKMIPNS